MYLWWGDWCWRWLRVAVKTFVMEVVVVVEAIAAVVEVVMVVVEM